MAFFQMHGLSQHMRTHENSAMASLDENLEQVEKELLEEADVMEEVYEEAEEKDDDIMEQEVKEQDMIEEKVDTNDQAKTPGRRVSRFAGKVFVCKVRKNMLRSSGHTFCKGKASRHVSNVYLKQKRN